jgi:nucleoside diphosphate kinase
VFAELQKTNLQIRAATLAVLTEAQAQDFYRQHKGKPFLPALVRNVTSAPVLAMQLQGEGAVATWRRMIGATDPLQSHPESLRARFGKDIICNGFHGADTKDSAILELGFFFPEKNKHLAPASAARLR